MNYTCPVCGYARLRMPPEDFLICPSCGTEFEYTDSAMTHVALRDLWIARGAQWHSRVVARPFGWNGYLQLIQAGYSVPQFVVSLETQPNYTATIRENLQPDAYELVPEYA
jgi:uncharacterized C2H2 Zn-finger protein